MLQSGEDPLYIARRLIVVASEDVGLADNTLLPLATAAHAAVEKIGLPEARINLAHTTVALALAPKSTRAYRALGNAIAACEEPGVAGLSVPVHLRNAPTRLMRELGYGREYKYPPDYKEGKVVQEVRHSCVFPSHQLAFPLSLWLITHSTFPPSSAIVNSSMIWTLVQKSIRILTRLSSSLSRIFWMNCNAMSIRVYTCDCF
jgi:hypothetical protein